MKENENISRNRPAEKGRKNDPDVRDRSAEQPGVSTMSSSSYDDANQHLTKTAADGFKASGNDENADRDLDEPNLKEK